MEITTLTEEEQDAIRNPEPPQGPSQEDLLKQIEADYLVAERNGDTKSMADLDERHSRVKTALDDLHAHKAYEHREKAAGKPETTPERPNAAPSH